MINLEMIFRFLTFDTANNLKQLKNNFLDTFTKFLKQLKVPVTESSALEYLETHPEEGSMLAYADALNHFKIENAAIKIKQEDLITLPTPFIAFSQIHGGTFSVIKNITENSIEWFDTQKGWVNEKLEEFTKTWSGVVLLAETDEKSGERNYSSKRRDEILKNIRIPIAILMIVLVFLFFILKAPFLGINIYLLLALKAAGMVVSTLLFVKSIDNANSLVNKLCNAGSKISCQSILDSPAAKITPWFSWSDAGFIYFFGSFLGLLFSLESSNFINNFLTLQIVFSLISILFSSYSLYYQAIKAKMWCTLCLGVVSIFFFEAIVSFTFFTPSSKKIFSLLGLLNTAFAFLIPIAFLTLFKNIAVKANASKKLKIHLAKLNKNPVLFEAMMGGQELLADIPVNLPIIKIGNQEAENTITVVSNPLCSPCSVMHARIEKILEQNQNLKCQIIFLTKTAKNDPGGLFVRKLFSLPEHLQHKAVTFWFSNNNKNFKNWNQQYLNYEDGMDNSSKLIQLLDWANKANIKGTPSIFFNNRSVSGPINLEDLAFILTN